MSKSRLGKAFHDVGSNSGKQGKNSNENLFGKDSIRILLPRYKYKILIHLKIGVSQNMYRLNTKPEICNIK